MRSATINSSLVRILCVEDHDVLAASLITGLIEEGFSVKGVRTGKEAIHQLQETWDLVILDLGLPDLPGEAVLSQICAKTDPPKVIILTARGEVDDKLSLFRKGCDDYLTKPFSFDELVERIRAVMRRTRSVKESTFSYEGILIDPQSLVLSFQQASAVLTKKEFSLLKHFMQSAGEIIGRQELIEHVWGLSREPETDLLGIQLHLLRKKLEMVGLHDWLWTIKGKGFRLKKPGTE